MEDVADSIPETIPTEETTPKSEKPDDYKSDVDFLSRNDDKEEAEDTRPSDQTEEELEEETEEKPKVVEKSEEDEKAPISAKDLVDRLNKTNPDFLRKNKDVRKAIYDSAQYNELFSHPDEATEVVENMRAMDRLAGQIMKGDAKALLYNIESTKKESLREFAKNFPMALYERDKGVFYDEIAAPVLSSALREAIEEGKRSGNDNLRKAANWISQHIFNQPEPPILRKNERDPEKERLQDELKNNTIAVYQTQKADLRSKVDDHIAELISQDAPKDASPKMREAFVREVMDELEDQLTSDNNHMNRMNALMDQWVDSKFNPGIRSRITSTYLNRVKLLLPTIKAKHREGYFPGNNVPKRTIKPIIPSGGSVRSSNGKVDPKNINWGKTSDLDILNGRVTLKK